MTPRETPKGPTTCDRPNDTHQMGLEVQSVCLVQLGSEAQYFMYLPSKTDAGFDQASDVRGNNTQFDPRTCTKVREAVLSNSAGGYG